MDVSENCIDIIKHYERFYAKPYLCPAGVPTIGYGSTRYKDGTKVSLKDNPITIEQADDLLRHEVNEIVKQITAAGLITSVVTQAQFDALVSFAYNVGTDIDADKKAEGLGDSTLLKLVNEDIMHMAHDWKKRITAEFNKWVFGGGKKLAGLVARRNTEALLFCDNTVKYFN